MKPCEIGGIKPGFGPSICGSITSNPGFISGCCSGVGRGGRKGAYGFFLGNGLGRGGGRGGRGGEAGRTGRG